MINATECCCSRSEERNENNVEKVMDESLYFQLKCDWMSDSEKTKGKRTK